MGYHGLGLRSAKDAPSFGVAAGFTGVVQALRPARILLVDDQPGDIALTRHYLFGDDDGDLTVAATAPEAFGQLLMARGEGAPVDLVLLDIGLPGEDGFSLLAAIRLHPQLRATPVVLYSGADDHDHHRRWGREMGVAGTIARPPSLERLREVIGRVPSLDLREDSGGVRLYALRITTSA